MCQLSNSRTQPTWEKGKNTLQTTPTNIDEYIKYMDVEPSISTSQTTIIKPTMIEISSSNKPAKPIWKFWSRRPISKTIDTSEESLLWEGFWSLTKSFQVTVSYNELLSNHFKDYITLNPDYGRPELILPADESEATDFGTLPVLIICGSKGETGNVKARGDKCFRKIIESYGGFKEFKTLLAQETNDESIKALQSTPQIISKTVHDNTQPKQFVFNDYSRNEGCMVLKIGPPAVVFLKCKTQQIQELCNLIEEFRSILGREGFEGNALQIARMLDEGITVQTSLHKCSPTWEQPQVVYRLSSEVTYPLHMNRRQISSFKMLCCNELKNSKGWKSKIPFGALIDTSLPIIECKMHTNVRSVVNGEGNVPVLDEKLEDSDANSEHLDVDTIIDSVK
ncbi:hypothetical protein NCAS_0G00320 [Naumovozyma castellii]|uniref:Uncharacterized protein n=1 Tax=Naumovozyma castellii TaxID=27288 RepID=G0VHN5_NAUCA|nr:hypothetical protein NCAS_0G00320 [Naumovozyma castellii CBS 4309]CCC70919.1 hypothetical protein NCAS_0G00320 [Naumovozyma castellii CBS 4309]